MAFTPRNKIMGLKEVANVDDLSNDNNKNKLKHSIPEKKSFLDQAIEVLNILDSKGINIYDKNRTPGMYLNKGINSKNSENKNLINILSLSEQNNHQQEQRNPKNIIDFLSNQK